MEVIKKVIGLILVIAIIFLLINARKILPSLNSLALGGNTTKTPFQVGTNYVDQIEKMTPKISGAGTYTGSAIGYGSFVNPYSYTGDTGNGYAATPSNKARATLEKNNGQLVLHMENIQIPSTPPIHVWLTNTQAIGNDTEYVDFGQVKSALGVQSFGVNLNAGDIDLSVYRYLMIVDPVSYKIYGIAALGK